MQGVWMYNFISKYAPQLEAPERQWAAVPFPHPADRPDLANITIADEDIYVMPRGAKHPDEALEFIKFMQSQKRHGDALPEAAQVSPPCERSARDFTRSIPNPFIKLFAELPDSQNTHGAAQDRHLAGVSGRDE